ncbi:carbohydrate binding domain-containing protein [bacterium]|nr:carbohydrate binding domain-containing protein [bacterium]
MTSKKTYFADELLGVERGNADILIFVLLAWSIALMNRGAATSVASYGLIFLSAILKLYPVAAFLIALRESKRKALVLILVLTASFLIYIWASFSDMVLLKNALPHDQYLSYGGSIIFHNLSNALKSIGIVIPIKKTYFCFSAVLITLVLIYSFLNRKRLDIPDQNHIDSFRIGALIYAATFLIANNYNYKLVFLLFTVPQILAWIKSGTKLGFFSSYALASLILTLWFNTWRFQFLVREIASWFLLIYFLCLLLLTMPAWILNSIASLFRDFASEIVIPLYRPLLLFSFIVIGMLLFEILNKVNEPGLAVVNPSNSKLKTVYPGNPRRYFHKDQKGEGRWLRVARGNQADFTWVSGPPEVLRVEIRKVETQNAYDIQLNLSHLEVKENHRYEIQFRARADNERSASVAFARSHHPWTDLGLYEDVNLTTFWQSFNKKFTATSNDANGRILFDVGGSNIPVEISSVTLRRIPDRQLIEPDLPPPKYFVEYRFNSLGCRGRDYQIPKPNGIERILFPGDSFTLGVGVHESDTLPNQLEGLLNRGALRSESKKSYEVINCGAGGYDLKQKRLFFQLIGEKYQPNLVFTMLNHPWEHVLWSYANPSTGEFQRLLYQWATPSQCLSGLSEEIRKLNHEIRQSGARMVLIIVGNDPRDSSRDFLTADPSIPVLNLAQSLYKKYSRRELEVYGLVDHHPNEIAHSIAAKEVLNFLQDEAFSIQSHNRLSEEKEFLGN